MWWLIVAHFISDWALQSEFIAMNKSKNNEVLLAHCFIYAGGISIALEYLVIFSWWKVVFIFVGHFITDYISSRYHKKIGVVPFSRKILCIDHSIHFTQLVIIFII